MTVARSPVVAVLVLQSPVVDQNSGMLTLQWLKWFTNISQAINAGLGLDGTALKMPFPTLGALGGVQASTPVDGEWVSQIDAFGVPQLSRPDFADLSGAITNAQLPTNLGPVSSGSGAPSSTPQDGSFYFDTSATPAHGYVRISGTWKQFS